MLPRLEHHLQMSLVTGIACLVCVIFAMYESTHVKERVKSCTNLFQGFLQVLGSFVSNLDAVIGTCAEGRTVSCTAGIRDRLKLWRRKGG